MLIEALSLESFFSCTTFERVSYAERVEIFLEFKTIEKCRLLLCSVYVPIDPYIFSGKSIIA